MPTLLRTILIAVGLAAMAQTALAATIGIEIRTGAGSTSSATPGPYTTAENLVTGRFFKGTINRRGRMTIRRLPPGVYRIYVQIQGRNGLRRKILYRRLGRRSYLRLVLDRNDGVPTRYGPQRLHTRLPGEIVTVRDAALQSVKQGQRAVAQQTTRELKKWLVEERRALAELNQVVASARKWLMAALPAKDRATLEQELAAAAGNPAEQYKIVLRHTHATQARLTATRDQFAPNTRAYRAANNRLRTISSAYGRLLNIYGRLELHHSSENALIDAIRQIDSALGKPTPTKKPPSTNQPKPKSQPTRTSQTPPRTPTRTSPFDSDDGPSCFTAGTRVLMADGSTRPVEQIRVGDRVRGQDGAVNTVIGVERPRLGRRLLYAINGGRAFVTAEHPFLTPGGWKSVDPAATAAENPRLKVRPLRVGDHVFVGIVAEGDGVRPASAGAPRTLRLRLVRIRRIAAQRQPASTVVYNLLLDGNNTYFADGFLVHNKG